MKSDVDPQDSVRATGDGVNGSHKKCNMSLDKQRCAQNCCNVKHVSDAGDCSSHSNWIDDIMSCPVFYPTKEEFINPMQYIEKIAPDVSKYGICKIVSPLVPSIPAGMVLTKEQSSFKFTTRVQTLRLSSWSKDDKAAFPMSGRYYTLSEYAKMANKVFARKFSTSASLPARFIEAEFWKEIMSGKARTVEYASDVEGSAFSKSPMDPLGQSPWNLKKISRLPNSVLRLLEAAIPGVTEPMLYIGMLFSMFAWHVEDHYLYSINYHHSGAAKTWYGVPGNAAVDFEAVIRQHVYDSQMLRDAGKAGELDLLLGKTTMFAPDLLLRHNVPVFRAVQNPGDFVVTFPRAYHAGFSHGFNCGEAVNFALPDWFPFGAASCWRYEFLNRVPLLPHEELVCKESMTVLQEHVKLSDKQESSVKLAFVALMRSQLEIQSSLKQQGARIAKSNFGGLLCSICKHSCYVSYITCRCRPEPVCLNHERLFDSCPCKSDRCIFVREEMNEFITAAQRYQCENGITSEVLNGFCINDIRLEEKKNTIASDAVGRVTKEISTLLQTTALNENIGMLSQSCSATGSVECKDWQEEESDTEMFQVKRRRILPLRSRQFQVDEHRIDLKKKTLIRDSGVHSKHEPDQGEKHKKGWQMDKLPSSMKGCQIRVLDVIRELAIKGSAKEIVDQWCNEAKNRGFKLKTKKEVMEGKIVEKLPLESCKDLKELLPEKQAQKFQELVSRNMKEICSNNVISDSVIVSNKGESILASSNESSSVRKERTVHKKRSKLVSERKNMGSEIDFQNSGQSDFIFNDQSSTKIENGKTLDQITQKDIPFKIKDFSSRQSNSAMESEMTSVEQGGDLQNEFEIADQKCSFANRLLKGKVNSSGMTKDPSANVDFSELKPTNVWCSNQELESSYGRHPILMERHTVDESRSHAGVPRYEWQNIVTDSLLEEGEVREENEEIGVSSAAEGDGCFTKHVSYLENLNSLPVVTADNNLKNGDISAVERTFTSRNNQQYLANDIHAEIVSKDKEYQDWNSTSSNTKHRNDLWPHQSSGLQTVGKEYFGEQRHDVWTCESFGFPSCQSGGPEPYPLYEEYSPGNYQYWKEEPPYKEFQRSHPHNTTVDEDTYYAGYVGRFNMHAGEQGAAHRTNEYEGIRYDRKMKASSQPQHPEPHSGRTFHGQGQSSFDSSQYVGFHGHHAMSVSIKNSHRFRPMSRRASKNTRSSFKRKPFYKNHSRPHHKSAVNKYEKERTPHNYHNNSRQYRFTHQAVGNWNIKHEETSLRSNEVEAYDPTKWEICYTTQGHYSVHNNHVGGSPYVGMT